MFSKILRYKAVQKLLTNFFVWSGVVTLVGLFHGVRGNELTSPYPKEQLTTLINWPVFGTLVVAGLAVFTLFSLIRHLSSDASTRRNSKKYSSNTIDELGSILYNFGSLTLVCVFVGAAKSLILVTVICYVFGLFFIHKNS